MLSQSQPVFHGNPSSVFEFFQESLTLVFRETKAFYRNLTIYMEMPDFAFDNCLIYTIFCKSYLKTATPKKSLFLSSGGHTYFYSFFSFLSFFPHFYLQYLQQPQPRNHYFCHQVDIHIFTLFFLFFFFFHIFISNICQS